MEGNFQDQNRPNSFPPNELILVKVDELRFIYLKRLNLTFNIQNYLAKLGVHCITASGWAFERYIESEQLRIHLFIFAGASMRMLL